MFKSSYAQSIKNRAFLDHETSDPVRAVIYARVSTDKKTQEESCANQVFLARERLKSMPNVVILDTFIDDGISAKNDFNRPEYMRMLSFISSEDIDLIITASKSRLNRDQQNAFWLRDFLVEHEVTVFTLDDTQIADYEDLAYETVDSIQAMFDAQYVSRQSQYGKRTQEVRISKKQLTAKDITFGYSWDPETKTISINPEEAEIVKELFDRYVFHDVIPSHLKLYLQTQGISRSVPGILKILSNEKYIGKFYINKFTSKLGKGKKKTVKIKNPKEEWVLIERPDLAIVDPDIFDLARRIHESHIHDTHAADDTGPGKHQARYIGNHLYSGKIYCGECGKAFRFCEIKNKQGIIPAYRPNNTVTCKNPIRRINEETITKVLSEGIKSLVDDWDTVFTEVESILKKVISDKEANQERIRKLKSEKTKIEQKYESLIVCIGDPEYSARAISSFKQTLKDYDARLDEITAELALLDNSEREKEIENRIERLKQELPKYKEVEKQIDREYVRHAIEKIIVQPDGTLEIIFNTGSNITKPLSDSEVEKARKISDNKNRFDIGLLTRDVPCYLPAMKLSDLETKRILIYTRNVTLEHQAFPILRTRYYV